MAWTVLSASEIEDWAEGVDWYALVYPVILRAADGLNDHENRLQFIEPFITPLGGFTIPLTWIGAAPSVKGTIVIASTTTDNACEIAPAGAISPIGVIYTAGVASTGTVRVVVSGIAEVLLKDGTASTHGNWVEVSGTTAGRADATAAAPVPATHWDEMGHCIESKGAGTDVLAKCVLHFN